jgi:hypothetical protein
MNISHGFHAKYPTEVGDEIYLAERLALSCTLRWTIWKTPKVLRTDPAAALHRFNFMRKDFGERGWFVVPGVPDFDGTRATNEHILTPSHPEWVEFQERLEGELVCPDFDLYYGPAAVVHPDTITSEFWPLCSAQLIADLGFAVAESLAVMWHFLGSDDEHIAKHVEGLWRKTKPSKRRPAFDADGILPRPVVREGL